MLACDLFNTKIDIGDHMNSDYVYRKTFYREVMNNNDG